jgi:hypothetical protein
MKNTEVKKQQKKSDEERYYSDSMNSMDYGDLVVYNEMTEQTTVRLKIAEQINLQLKQLDELTKKRQFMLKEVLQHIIE